MRWSTFRGYGFGEREGRLHDGQPRGVGAEAARRLRAKGAKLVLTNLDQRKFIPPLPPQMYAEAAALGRSISARTDALEKQ